MSTFKLTGYEMCFQSRLQFLNVTLFYRVFWNKMHSTGHSWPAALRLSLFPISLLGIFHLLLKYLMYHIIIFIRYLKIILVIMNETNHLLATLFT